MKQYAVILNRPDDEDGNTKVFCYCANTDRFQFDKMDDAYALQKIMKHNYPELQYDLIVFELL